VTWLTLLALLAAGYGPSRAAPRDELSGIVWRWNALAGIETLEIDRPGKYTLEFHEDGRYAARADCNRANGSFTLEEGRLSLGPAAATLAECGPDSHANRFLGLLGEVDGYRRDGDRLVLTLADDAGELVLEAARKLVLAGSTWVVRAVNNGRGGVVSVANGTSLDAHFGSDRSVAGSAGCNRYHARYELEGDALAIGPAAATRKMCGAPEGVMEQEAAFLAALGTVARIDFRGTRLQLRTAEGSLAVDLVAAVAGTLLPRGSAVLPADARARIQLEDVSRADVAAPVIGESSFPLNGRQAPLPFQVAFDPSDIDPRHTYAIRAVIEDAAGRTLFRTTETHRVLTRESPTLGVEVRLDPAR
jgi:heat shock protein HslJ